MPSLLSTTQTMNSNWSSSPARRMLTVAHVASLAPKCNARRLRVCKTVNSGHISGGVRPTITGPQASRLCRLPGGVSC